MATHIGIVCPACQEIGKVRTTFLGRKIRCKHCGSAFRTPSHEEGAPTSASPVSTFEERMSGGRAEATGGNAATLEAAPEVLLAKLEARNQKYAVVKQQLFETRELCDQLERQVQEIRDEAERVREERRRDESLARDLEEARTERDRLGALVQDLEGRLAGDEGLAEELQASRSEVERLRTELASTRSADERREAVEMARAEWERRLDEALRRVADLDEALGASREERDVLRARVEEQDRGRGALEAEREVLKAEAVEGARAEYEAERRALQANWDEERGALAAQVEQRVRMDEERDEAEHRTRREQAEIALLRSEHEREVLQGMLDRLQQEIVPLRGEYKATHTLIASLTRECEETAAYRDQLLVAFQEREAANQARIAQLDHALHQAIQEKDAERLRGGELADVVNTLRAEREQQQQDRECERRQSLQILATLQEDLKAQHLWIERIAADRPHLEERESPEGERDELRQEINALRDDREATRMLIESLSREREQTAAFRSQLKASFQEREEAYQSRLAELSQALQQASHEKAAMCQRGNELIGQVRELRDQLNRQTQIRDDDRRRSPSLVGPRPQGPAITPPAELTVPVAEAGVSLAFTHTDVALSQLGSFHVRRK